MEVRPYVSKRQRKEIVTGSATEGRKMEDHPSLPTSSSIASSRDGDGDGDAGEKKMKLVDQEDALKGRDGKEICENEGKDRSKEAKRDSLKERIRKKLDASREEDGTMCQREEELGDRKRNEKRRENKQKLPPKRMKEIFSKPGLRRKVVPTIIDVRIGRGIEGSHARVAMVHQMKCEIGRSIKKGTSKLRK
jgi:hypothetical protein